jgi:phosphoribosylanthranilate isomerase
MQTRIKFCGLTRQQDVQHAVALGVDALGFVFVKNSARNIDIVTAVNLVREVPPFIIKVGLFMNANVADIENVIKDVKLNLLQFHGDEDEGFCAQFNMPYLKAVPMASTSSLEEFCENFETATGFLLDSHAQGQMGGSGEKFTWSEVPKNLNKPIILAGGLTVDNVAEAIRVVHPYAVDVSSGIEASKGVKDPAKMDKFIKEAHRD